MKPSDTDTARSDPLIGSDRSGTVQIKHCYCTHAKIDHFPAPNPQSNATPCKHRDCDCSQFRLDPKYEE